MAVTQWESHAGRLGSSAGRGRCSDGVGVEARGGKDLGHGACGEVRGGLVGKGCFKEGSL